MYVCGCSPILCHYSALALHCSFTLIPSNILKFLTSSHNHTAIPYQLWSMLFMFLCLCLSAVSSSVLSPSSNSSVFFLLNCCHPSDYFSYSPLLYCHTPRVRKGTTLYLPSLLRQMPSCNLDNIYTHSLYGLSVYTKQYLVALYKDIYTDTTRYICI